MDNKDVQRLALLQALAKAAKAETDPSKDGLRRRLDAELVERYEREGIDRCRLNINGMEVGTYSIAFSKASESKELFIAEPSDFIRWLQTTDEGTDTLRASLHSISKALLDAAKGYGFLPDGCYDDVVVKESRPTGTRLAVEPQKVAQALKGELPAAIAGALMPGEVG